MKDCGGRIINAFGRRRILKNGRIRYQHIGEFSRGTDLQAVAVIETLMAEPDPVE